MKELTVLTLAVILLALPVAAQVVSPAIKVPCTVTLEDFTGTGIRFQTGAPDDSADESHKWFSLRDPAGDLLFYVWMFHDSGPDGFEMKGGNGLAFAHPLQPNETYYLFVSCTDMKPHTPRNTEGVMEVTLPPPPYVTSVQNLGEMTP